jgi:cytoskeleton protein RodZ
MAGPATERLGADLRAARERLGWSLPAVAAHLRIRTPYLEAIEDGRTDELPGPAYAVGFIRAYAQALGLDPGEAARRFRQEAGEPQRRTELEFPAPVPERGVPALVVVLIGIVVAVGAYATWYRMSGNDHPATEVVQQVPDRLVPLVPDHPAAPAPAAPVPAASESASGAASQMASVAPLPPSGVPPSAAAAATTQPAIGLPAGGPPPPRLTIRTTGDAWIQVRAAQGQILVNRLMHAGEAWPVPDRPDLSMSTGNAGATELVMDGADDAQPLGAEGAVRRDIRLGPDALKHALRQAPKQAADSSGSGPQIFIPHNE